MFCNYVKKEPEIMDAQKLSNQLRQEESNSKEDKQNNQELYILIILVKLTILCVLKLLKMCKNIYQRHNEMVLERNFIATKKNEDVESGSS